MEEMRLDGNAAAGMLTELFAMDATGASATCAGCGRIAPLGALPEYGQAMGVVLRCASCDTAVLRIARTPGRLHVDFSGVSLLMIPV
ncbi:MAG TPA: DUF6510 family protein [Gemmatimonadaceae bacterium]